MHTPPLQSDDDEHPASFENEIPLPWEIVPSRLASLAPPPFPPVLAFDPHPAVPAAAAIAEM